MSERDHQAALFRYGAMQGLAVPEWDELFHVPNGGKRDKKTAWVLKQEGVKPGIPDLWLMVPRGGYHGLVIELKNDAPKGTLTPDQKWWIERLAFRGYLTKVAYGWLEAKDQIEKYLKL